MLDCKGKYCQELYDADEDRRVEFCKIMVQKFNSDPAWHKKLVFSDEASFSLNGSVNKHNVHWYAAENPHFKITK